jgi:hypothetical protein
MISWLDAHAGTVTALATVLLTVVTGGYVALTRRLVREQREHTRRIAAPLLDFRIDALDDGVAGLVARNIGAAPARWLALFYVPRPPTGTWRLADMGPWGDLGVGEWRRWGLMGVDIEEDVAELASLPLLCRLVDAAWEEVILEVMQLYEIEGDPRELRLWRVTSLRLDRSEMVTCSLSAIRVPVRWWSRWKMRHLDIGDIWEHPLFEAWLDVWVKAMYQKGGRPLP